MELLNKNIFNLINVVFIFCWMLFIPKVLVLVGVDYYLGLLVAVIAYVIIGITISDKITSLAKKV